LYYLFIIIFFFISFPEENNNRNAFLSDSISPSPLSEREDDPTAPAAALPHYPVVNICFTLMTRISFGKMTEELGNFKSFFFCVLLLLLLFLSVCVLSSLLCLQAEYKCILSDNSSHYDCLILTVIVLCRTERTVIFIRNL